MQPVALELIAFLAAVWLLLAFVLSNPKSQIKSWLIIRIQESVVIGILGTAVTSLILFPSFAAGIVVIGAYQPHAVFVVMWCIFTLVVLRKVFGAKYLLVSLAFLYGLQEIIFNSMAFIIQFVYHVTVDFFAAPLWDYFFLVIIGATLVSFVILRPRFVRSPVLIPFVFFLAIWFWFGLPSIDDALLGDIPNVVWDISYQLDIFMLGYFVIKPR